MHDNKTALMRYRLDMSKEQLRSSEILLDAGNYKDSIGRSYYSMFTATRALLALDCVDFSKHTGVISYFQKEYVKTGIIDKKYSKFLSEAFQIRNNTDYADFFIVSKEDAKEQHDRADKFLMAVSDYIELKVNASVKEEDNKQEGS